MALHEWILKPINLYISFIVYQTKPLYVKLGYISVGYKIQITNEFRSIKEHLQTVRTSKFNIWIIIYFKS